MGYFANGAEGMDYQEQYCFRCRHWPDDDRVGEGCVVWLAHLLYGYELCNEEKNPLNILIPRTKDGLGNEQCAMFLARTDGKVRR